MASQIDEPPRIFFGTSPEEESRGEAEPAEGLNHQAAELLAHESDAELFCRCRGAFKSVTGYFVACESDAACANGGWLHPECTSDLRHLTKEQIDTIVTWYCQDCREQHLDAGDEDDGEDEEDVDDDHNLISVYDEVEEARSQGEGDDAEQEPHLGD